MRKDHPSEAEDFVFTYMPKDSASAGSLVFLSPHKHNALLLFYNGKHCKRHNLSLSFSY